MSDELFNCIYSHAQALEAEEQQAIAARDGRSLRQRKLEARRARLLARQRTPRRRTYKPRARTPAKVLRDLKAAAQRLKLLAKTGSLPPSSPHALAPVQLAHLLLAKTDALSRGLNRLPKLAHTGQRLAALVNRHKHRKKFAKHASCR